MSQSASTSVRRNALLNLVGSILPVLISVITVPAYLHLIGSARYGVLAIIWVLLNYFSFFNMGLGRAITHQIAKLRDAPPHESETAFWTALLLNTVFGVLGGSLMLVLGHVLFGRMFKIPTELLPEVLSALPWLAAAVPLITVSSVLSGALEGQERFLTVNILGVTTTVLIQVVPLIIAIEKGPNLVWLIGSIVLIRFMSSILTFLACIIYLPLTRLPRFDTKKVSLLFRYGGWITVTGLINPFLLTLDQLVIGVRIGVQSVPAYSIPYNVVTQILMLPSSLSRTLFPRFSMLKREEVQIIGRDTSIGLAVVITPILVGSCVLLDPVLQLWVGSTIANMASPVGQILLIGIWFNSLAFIPYAWLQGQGRPDLTAKFHMFEFLPYLLLLWAGATTAGLQGVAWAWVIRVAVDAALLFRAVHIPWKDLKPLTFPCILVLVTSFSSLTLFTHPIWRFVIGGSLELIALLWAWHMAPQDIKILIRRFPKVWKDARAAKV